MNMFSPKDVVEGFEIVTNSIVSSGVEIDIADGSLIDTAHYEWLLVMASASTVAGTNGQVKFYHSATNAASGQSALTQYDDDTGTTGSVDMTFTSTEEMQMVAIRCNASSRYINIGVLANGGNFRAHIKALGICRRKSKNVTATVGSSITELTLA